ncbi:MAG: tetratricopeptide repeat protein [Candidatus Omnitrophota bacterium]|nr:tetratricopeptide repeat protein [Candidatus Omnitrophota bacterium]MDZ4241689.1 tetratricopeptide repeat protein [Candidatus Omnitrophota bacterium]
MQGLKQRQISFLGPTVVFLTIGLAIYGHVLHGEFVSDDYQAIVDNKAVQNGDLWGIWLTFNTRFLTGLTFWLNARWGQMDTYGFHLVNILLHVVNAFLVHAFVTATFQTPAMRREGLAESVSRPVAFFAALIFLCHPVQTEAAAFITQRTSLLATFFYLATCLLYIRGRASGRGMFFFVSWGTMLWGVFSKELTLTLPFVLLLYEFYFFGFQGLGWKRSARIFFPYFLLLALVPAVLWLDNDPSSVLELKSQMSTGGFRWQYVLTEANVWRTYLRLVILPVNLNHDYDYPVAKTLWDPGTMFSLALLAVIAVWAAAQFSRRRLVSFGIFWFFLTVTVETLVVCFVHRQMLYEHWLYLPMAGAAVVLSFLAMELPRSPKAGKLVLTALVVVFSMMSYQRNLVWREEVAFWQDAVQKSPRKPSAHFALGTAYYRKDEFEKAYYHLKKALALHDSRTKKGEIGIDYLLMTGLHNNLGIIYFLYGDDDMAVASFQEAVQWDPENGRPYNNLALLYFNLGDCAKTIDNFQLAVQKMGEYGEAVFRIGQCQLRLGDEAGGRENLPKAVELLIKEGRLDEARQVQKAFPAQVSPEKK